MTIATLGAAAGSLLLFVVFFIIVHRRGSRLRAALARSGDEAAVQAAAAAGVRTQLTVAAAGEREAAWVARTAGARAISLRDHVTSLEDRLRASEDRAADLERAVGGLRDELATSHQTSSRHQTATESALTRAASLESEVLTARREVSTLHDELEAARLRTEAPAPPQPGAHPDSDDLRRRLHGALGEVDRLRDRVGALETTLALSRLPAPSGPEPLLLPADPWDPRREIAVRDTSIAHLSAELDQARRAAFASRTEVDRLGADIARIRQEAEYRVAAAVARITPAEPQPAPQQPEPKLIAREAEIRDLEQRLITLSATRNAELKRLNERIASLERLYVDLDARDARIAELEAELKQATEMLDVIRSDADRLESRLAAARSEVAASRRVEATATELTSHLAEARRRVADLETAALRSTSTDDEIAQLRSLLAAERDRNLRLERRAATEGGSTDVTRAVAAATFPLRDTIARLERELAARVTPPPAPINDDVILIRGIGPRIAAILAANGITSLRQIAAFTAGDIARIGPLLPVYPERIADDNWVEQARRLIAGIR